MKYASKKKVPLTLQTDQSRLSFPSGSAIGLGLCLLPELAVLLLVPRQGAAAFPSSSPDVGIGLCLLLAADARPPLLAVLRYGEGLLLALKNLSSVGLLVVL